MNCHAIATYIMGEYLQVSITITVRQRQTQAYGRMRNGHDHQNDILDDGQYIVCDYMVLLQAHYRYILSLVNPKMQTQICRKSLRRAPSRQK